MPNPLPDWGFLRPNGRLIWATILLLAMAVPIVIALRRPKSERPTTWAQAMGGAVYVFAMMLLAYAVIPHEFITASDKYWGLATNRFLIKSTTAIPFLTSWDWPFSIDLQHGVRDPLVVGIYLVFLVANIAFIVLWQKRKTASEVASAPLVKVGRSRFGRPLKAKA